MRKAAGFTLFTGRRWTKTFPSPDLPWRGEAIGRVRRVRRHEPGSSHSNMRSQRRKSVFLAIPS